MTIRNGRAGIRRSTEDASEGNADVLDLRVGQQRLDALPAAVAGPLHAAERQLDAAAHAVGVDEDLAGVDAVGDAVRAAEVARPDAGDEPVLGEVGQRDGVAVVVEGQRRQHRAEDLLLEDVHLRLDVGDERRLQVQALGVLAADAIVAPWLSALASMPRGALELALGDQRAEVRVLDAGADRDLAAALS